MGEFNVCNIHVPYLKAWLIGFSSSLNYEILQLIKENDYSLQKRQSHLTIHITVYCRPLHNNCNLAIRNSKGSYQSYSTILGESGKAQIIWSMLNSQRKKRHKLKIYSLVTIYYFQSKEVHYNFQMYKPPKRLFFFLFDRDII